MVPVLGNATGLMEDLPKDDVNPDFFFFIVYPSSLTYLFLDIKSYSIYTGEWGKAKGQ